MLTVSLSVIAFALPAAVTTGTWLASTERALLCRLPLQEGAEGLPLDEVARSEFDHAAVFGPYASTEQMEAQLSVRWPRGQTNIVAMSEGYQALLFAKGGQLVSIVPIPRALGDYCVADGMLLRASAERCGRHNKVGS